MLGAPGLVGNDGSQADMLCIPTPGTGIVENKKEPGDDLTQSLFREKTLNAGVRGVRGRGEESVSSREETIFLAENLDCAASAKVRMEGCVSVKSSEQTALQ